MSKEPPPILAIVGPTASGKSDAAIGLAHALGGEVINLDSLQVYRYFDIGTGKLPRHQWQGIPHHLLDILDPHEAYDAACFQRDADQCIAAIRSRGKRPILAGGTGLYLRALLHGLFDIPSDPKIRAALQAEAAADRPGLYARLQEVDPAAAAKINPNDAVRIVRALEVHAITGQPFSAMAAAHGHREQRHEAILLGINPERALLYQRIDRRIDAMLAAGWTAEVEMLRQMGVTADLKPMQCIGYRELNLMLDGQLDPDDAIAKIRKSTRAYARRQLTWFRKEDVRWFDSPDALLDLVGDAPAL